ncbi:BTB/POZ domain-containing protein [Rhizophagus diaphanus]|nr:BTB/POZ domain-containing protein [Rhizophagus diaphanus] [Rhizophagus sp. MUCL 43196]
MAFEEIINDYEKLLESGEEHNVVIYVGENEDVEEVHAHSNILRIRSQYFRTALSNESAKKKDGKFTFKKPNISPQFFKIILRFIYCGKIDFKGLEGPDILKLLMAADVFKIQSLNNRIQEYLIKHQFEFLQKNPSEILEIVYQHETLTDLWDFYLENICLEPEILFESDKFLNLNVTLLELILKRDDLSLDESVIWDYLIKWCFSQNPSIQENIKKWNKDEITSMENTLNGFIPLIRFYHMSSEDFLDKVYPFKALLPEDLINSILAFHMKKQTIDTQPPRKLKSSYDSIIIEPQHFAIFSNWIGKIDKRDNSYYNIRNIPYDFKLIYRASEDGNTTEAFHSKCDNKGATLIVAKIKNSEQIIGGYNPFSWNSENKYKSTCDSFIFSFINKDYLQSGKVGYSNGNSRSIGNYLSYGPIFGSGNDLRFYNGIWYSDIGSYPKLDIPRKFKTDDYEVFHVIKNGHS